MSAEIPGSPLSRHDIDVIWTQTSRARLKRMNVVEVHISARRQPNEGLVLFGNVPVRPREHLGLHSGLLIVEGHEPIFFDFEAGAQK